MKQILDYSKIPGPDGKISQVWPQESTLKRSTGLMTLVMAVHPKCACTQASIEELARIMTAAKGRLIAHVLVVPIAASSQSEAEAGDEAMSSYVWRRGAETPGVKVHLDLEGRESKLFGALVSGKVMLFDDAGTLVFDGGITAARGHQGDNAGKDAVIAWAKGAKTATRHMPVFGCLLFGPERHYAARH